MTLSLPKRQGAFDPTAAHMLGEVCDEIWASLHGSEIALVLKVSTS
jgi:hypothetical protein